MLQFLTNDGPLIAKILLYVGCINIVLSALQQLMMKLVPADQQDSNVVLTWDKKILGVLGKVVDWLSANQPHP